uniref:Putative secreted protein n=1 Tax=Anopheles triannulatus TaxID=58253 RepID=A0A2M4B1S2_9DIPT
MMLADRLPVWLTMVGPLLGDGAGATIPEVDRTGEGSSLWCLEETGIRSPVVCCRPVTASVPMCVVRTGLAPLELRPTELRLWLEPTDVRRRGFAADPAPLIAGTLAPAMLCRTEDSCV